LQKGLSPRPTGLRAEFLQHILADGKIPAAKQLLKELTNFVTRGAQGAWTPEAFQALNNGFVVPFLRRMVGSVHLALVVYSKMLAPTSSGRPICYVSAAVWDGLQSK